ncbi:PTS system, mannose-specific IIB component [Lactobacillus sp. wkB8] [Lactiplantibacillus mudanjiangensis]|uniref:PTS sugar transporter subunit IIA n=1 Tax=Lactiplantibacillus mudanjiangensis TaxID=1296538 RepID=UPI0010152948|nr:mannose/fructose/sorbose PTS transporter subunit IIA [Lactiplantibacillus mudanjiangensis]VDG32009.1 PTS system, mannose-specific IIB component [Lactobacillus sp. wkB8] [Lactiplantibacillus mudanjiangensis]
MKVVLIGHGHTAEAMKGAVEMIFGEVADFYPVAFLPKEGLQELITKMKTVTDDFEAKDTLVIADLFAGTPYNAAATLALQHEVQDVIAGMSLPICLEIASQMNQLSVTELVTYIMKNSRDYTKALSIINQEQAAEEDF